MSKIFNSTQKQWNNKNKQWLEKPLQKKARPNSAQTIGVADTHSPSHNQEGRNGDLKIQIRSLNEKSDDNRKDSSPQSNKIDNPNKSNKHAYVPEVDSNKLMQMGHNDDTSSISRQLKPVYKNNGEANVNSPDKNHESEYYYSGLHKSKLSKSKEKKTKNLKDLAIPTVNQRKLPITRPFSGDPTKPKKIPKINFKNPVAKVRPKTAKISEKQMDEILRSPDSKLFLSPKASKKSLKKQKSNKSKTRKSNKKVSKFNRKASMSPSNDHLLNGKQQKLQLKHSNKHTFMNRRSMNDLNVDKSVPINVLTTCEEPETSGVPTILKSNYVIRKTVNDKLVTVQKYLRGYLVFRLIREYRREMRAKSKNKSKPKPIEETKQDDLVIQRMNSSSSNTLERATNQNDIIKGMIITRQESDGHHSGSASDYYSEKIPKEEIKIDIKPKLKLLQKKVNEHRKNASNNILSKSVSIVDKDIEQDSQTIKLDTKNSQLKILKKRPNSAQNQENRPTENKSRTETNKKLKEIFEKFKSLQKDTKSKTEEFKSSKSKPPINTRVQRNERSDPNHRSSDSFSEKFSQMSPSNGSFKPFSDEKYQRLIKNQIYADYKNKKNEVNNKFSRKMDRFEALFNQKMISSDSFEKHKSTLEEWKEKNYKKLEKKRNK